MGRIEATYEAAIERKASVLAGDIREPRNPVMLWTSRGFAFGEENAKNAVALTTNLNTQEDWEVADAGEFLNWLGEEYIADGKTEEDWLRAVKLVQAGSPFSLLFPWSKPPARTAAAKATPAITKTKRMLRKLRARTPNGLCDPQNDFEKMWTWLTMTHARIKSLVELPPDQQLAIIEARETAKAIVEGSSLPPDYAAKLAWELWQKMPAYAL
jgi:hypothetical protein